MLDFNEELVGAQNAKSTLKDSGAKDQRETVFMVPFEKLVILPEFNVREHDDAREERIERYKEDMKLNGYMPSKPMEIFVDAEGRIIVTDGHTRHESARRARAEGAQSLDMIPAIPAKKGTSMEDLTINLVKSNDGEKLSPLGMSLVVKRLCNTFHHTPAEAAKLIGVSPKYAGQLLTLAGAPQRIRDLIMKGFVSATHAIEMLEQHGENAADLLEEGLKEAQSKGKKRVSKKTTETREDKMNKARAKNAVALFQLVELLVEKVDAGESQIPKDIYDKFETLLINVDKAGEE